MSVGDHSYDGTALSGDDLGRSGEVCDAFERDGHRGVGVFGDEAFVVGVCSGDELCDHFDLVADAEHCFAAGSRRP